MAVQTPALPLQYWRSLPPRRRAIWIAVVVWCVLHLVGFAGAVLLMPDFERDEVEKWSDIDVYLDAADAVRQHAPLYVMDDWDDSMVYFYHPAFALACVPLTYLPFRLLSLLWIVMQTAAYLGALWAWYRVLVRIGWIEGARVYRLWLPLALVFSEWYANLFYGNVVSTLLLLSGLMTLGIVEDRPRLAGIAGALILILKPQWLFPLILPVIFRRWRFLLHLLAVLLAGYLLITAGFVLATGLSYGVETLRAYPDFLTTLDANYPWSMGTGLFENMNHSWQQIYHSYFGSRAWVEPLTILTRLVMLALPGLLILQAWRRRITLTDHPALAIWFAGLGYLTAMSMLAQLWEVMGSIVFFLAIQAAPNPQVRRWSRLYLIYATFELQAVISALTGWQWAFLPQTVPLAMLALLLLYGCLLVLAAHTVSNTRKPEYGGNAP